MFLEYRALVSRLKNGEAHFSVFFNEHNELDAEIKEK